MEPKIIFEDEDILVIDKPAGVTVNAAQSVKEETVQDWIARNFQFPISNDQLRRNGIVHRIDKETSGILLIAKNAKSFENLQRQFKERSVKKKYVALVHGKVTPEEGEIRVPVGRLPWNRMRFGVLAGGREAVTKYRRLSVFSSRLSDIGQSVVGLSVKPKNRQQTNWKPKTDNGKPITEYYSLLELQPQTGRTHQIRVHLKYMGHPIVSDPLYAGRKQAREDRKWCPRLFLHANGISFRHPRTGEMTTFESNLPDDLRGALSILKSKD